MAVITLAVEGLVDSAVARRLCEDIGHDIGPVHILNGKTRLDPKLRAYNHAATHAPWLVLRDLDHDAPCAVELRQRLLPEPAARMIFRITVRSVESWLLADRRGLAQYLGVAANKLPTLPDQLDNPKQELVNLARLSRNRRIREDIVPEPGFGTSVGPGYTARVSEFVQGLWSPSRATEHSDSLQRCVHALAGGTF
jgi:hypothetical protein